MFQDFKNRIKSATPSLRSVKSQDRQSSLPQIASTPVLSLTNRSSSVQESSVVRVSLSQEKLPENHSKRRSFSSIQSISHYTHVDRPSSESSFPSISGQRTTTTTPITTSNSPSAASSSASLSSMPATPPMKHARNPTNFSLPSTMSFMNQTHLKPGNNAELLSYKTTINMYRENAKRTNDPNIQCELAVYLYEASKKNNEQTCDEKREYLLEATKMLRTLSLRGHAESQYYLANIYASGAMHKSGKNKPDFGNAFPLFVQAAKHQHADAAYRAAKCYEDGLGCLKNKSKAVQYYKLAGTLNHPGAMYRLGLANINASLGLNSNVRDGNKWLKRSASAATVEYPHALHELGLLHEKGLDNLIFKDVGYSMQLYARAAELGYVPSAYRLGECFEFGYLGCPKDMSASMHYYMIAARQGNAEACYSLSSLYLGVDVEQHEQKALYWAKVAAEMGLPKAEFALGYFAELGIGRPIDPKEAMNWYTKATSHGDLQAPKRLSALKTNVINNNTNNKMSIPSSLIAGKAR